MMNTKHKDYKRYKVVPYEEFMDYIQDQRDKLQDFVDELDTDIDAFQKWWVGDKDLSTYDRFMENIKDGDKKCK